MITTVFVSTLAFAACRTVPVDDSPKAPRASTHTSALTPEQLAKGESQLEGRIDESDIGAIENLRISLHRVNTEGKLEKLTERVVTTDVEGRYRTTVNVPKASMVNIVIMAEREGAAGRGMAVVPSWSVVDGVIIAPTIDLESAVESDVYISAAKQGLWVHNLGTNELRSLISGRLAKMLRASNQYDHDVEVMAEASVAAIESWYRTLLDPSNGLEPQQVEAIFEAKAWAQVALDAQIYGAKSETDVEQAHNIHTIAVHAAYNSAGVAPEHLALAGQASADTMRRFAQAMSEPMRAMLISEAESIRAYYVIGAVDSLLSRAKRPLAEREEARSAGMSLARRLAIAAESSAPDDVVRAAWKDYQAEVKNKLDAIAEGHREHETPVIHEEEEEEKVEVI